MTQTGGKNRMWVVYALLSAFFAAALFTIPSSSATMKSGLFCKPEVRKEI